MFSSVRKHPGCLFYSRGVFCFDDVGLCHYKQGKDSDIFLLKHYNKALYYLCIDYSIRSGDPQEKIEVFAICNQHLKTFYGENAPQIGEVVTPEQYEKIWGEKPLDISYIPGAIVNLPAIIATPEGIITEN